MTREEWMEHPNGTYTDDGAPGLHVAEQCGFPHISDQALPIRIPSYILEVEITDD